MFLPTSREAWQEVVNKMITAYKAPVSRDDAKAIVDYLVRTKGNRQTFVMDSPGAWVSHVSIDLVRDSR